MSKVQLLSLYTVTAQEIESRSEWDVSVAATSEHDARRIGINALEEKGLINRHKIKRVSVHHHNADIYGGV